MINNIKTMVSFVSEGMMDDIQLPNIMKQTVYHVLRPVVPDEIVACSSITVTTLSQLRSRQ